ncbi:hypothetical protein BDM02DRAFT_1069890 [Thelephora ganbajun]|uniref:Uncharacterized protein n=1 Tax=Thelephora ganbajun TaxID=370292 RepID=A0ACB6ZWV8_THEGA|nr:hypothetical protein BDM02DRAFT_1069890 [Thelephora ganbajun]
MHHALANTLLTSASRLSSSEWSCNVCHRIFATEYHGLPRARAWLVLLWIGIRLVRRSRYETSLIASSRCCRGKTLGGPLDSDTFEREAHKEIAELKARSRIRQLEAEQRRLQQNQPTPAEDMTAKPE